MRKWQFTQTLNGQWYWRQLHDDGDAVDSDRTFNSRLECVADAFEHGYCSPTVRQSIVDVPTSMRPAKAA